MRERATARIAGGGGKAGGMHDTNSQRTWTVTAIDRDNLHTAGAETSSRHPARSHRA